jgi:hypothetical protein
MEPSPPLLALSIADISAEFVESLVRQAIRESLTLEYKREPNPKVLESIAAMTNTYGGLILIGITNELKVVGVDSDCESRVVNQCQSKLEPPVVPDMRLVEGVGADRVTVLAIRVDANKLPRPLVIDGKVWVRFPGRNAPADRLRMFSLFSEARTAPSTGASYGTNLPPSQWHPPPGKEKDEALMVVRSVLRLEAPAVGRLPVLDSALRRTLIERLADTEVVRWRDGRRLFKDRHQSTNWVLKGVNNSRHATLHVEPPDGDPEVPTLRAILTVPEFRGPVTFLLDVIFRQGAEGERSISDVIELIIHMLDDCIHNVGFPLLQELVGTGLWIEGFLEARMECIHSSFSDWIDLRRFDRLPESSDFGATAPLILSTSSIKRPFRPQIAEWLKTLLLDLGYVDFEDTLDEWHV